MVLTGREKATIFLSILGADVSSRILRYLPGELADLIASGINHLPTPSPEALAEVMGEFHSFLALPERRTEALPRPVAPVRSYGVLMYERPQVAAFLISLLPDEERPAALGAIPRERQVVEELILNLKETSLRPKLEARMRSMFAGKLF
ncbi:MAG: hypothetical protein WC632_07945 [Candidatus Margulisiibacteriota bacterium]